MLGKTCRHRRAARTVLTVRTELYRVDCSNNQLESLVVHSDFSDSLICYGNELKFSTLPSPDNIRGYAYADNDNGITQSPVSVNFADRKVDLSSEYSVGDNMTVYTWYYENGTAVESDKVTDLGNGVFQFGVDLNGNRVYCEMSNATFPDLLLSTETVAIVGIAAPASASAVQATGNRTQISWDAVAEASSYEIMGYNAKDNYRWKIDDTTDTSYTASAYTTDVTLIAVYTVNGSDRSAGTTTTIFRAPTNVSSVAASGNQTQISWDAVAGATSYDVMGYNAAGNYWWKIDTTSETSLAASGYTTNVTAIAIHAIRGSERTAGATTSIFRGPTEASAIVASATETKITWSAVAGATSYEIMGYNKAGNYWWSIGTTTDTSLTAPGYSANVTTIAIHAIRGEERTSGTATTVVRTPSNVAAMSLSATSARITWDAVPGATGYELAIYNSETKKWSVLAQLTDNWPSISNRRTAADQQLSDGAGKI